MHETFHLSSDSRPWSGHSVHQLASCASRLISAPGEREEQGWQTLWADSPTKWRGSIWVAILPPGSPQTLPPSWPSHLPKAPPPNAITLGVEIPAYTFGGGATNTQSIRAVPRYLVKHYSRWSGKVFFGMRLTFKSLLWIKQVALHNVSGPCPISWRLIPQRAGTVSADSGQTRDLTFPGLQPALPTLDLQPRAMQAAQLLTVPLSLSLSLYTPFSLYI